MSPAKYN